MYYKPSPLLEDISITNLYTVHYFEYYKDYQFKGESHNFWEILYVDKGEVAVIGGNRHLILQAGQMIFHKPGEFHSVEANGVVAPNTIVLSFDCSSSAMRYFEDKLLYADDDIKTMIARIVAEAKSVYRNDLNDPLYRQLIPRKESPFGGYQIIKIYLELMLIELLRRGIPTRHSASHRTMRQYFSNSRVFADVVKYIDGNMGKWPTISDICRANAINRSSLERIFKEQTGMSILQFCRHRKIEQAKRLMRQEERNLTQISGSLGFHSLHYFSRVFKQITGMTPTQYAMSAKAMIDHSNQVLSPPPS